MGTNSRKKGVHFIGSRELNIARSEKYKYGKKIRVLGSLTVSGNEKMTRFPETVSDPKSFVLRHLCPRTRSKRNNILCFGINRAREILSSFYTQVFGSLFETFYWINIFDFTLLKNISVIFYQDMRMISCKNNYLRIHVCTIRKGKIRALSPLAVFTCRSAYCICVF